MAAAASGLRALPGTTHAAAAAPATSGEPIKIGILHSLSGTTAISETTLKDVMLMLVSADLSAMDRDARRMRGERPFVFANIRAGEGVSDIASFVEHAGGLSA
jgi:Ni2+-binding GTPase involved in maturation of urease and hydrogenase